MQHCKSVLLTPQQTPHGRWFTGSNPSWDNGFTQNTVWMKAGIRVTNNTCQRQLKQNKLHNSRQQSQSWMNPPTLPRKRDSLKKKFFLKFAYELKYSLWRVKLVTMCSESYRLSPHIVWKRLLTQHQTKHQHWGKHYVLDHDLDVKVIIWRVNMTGKDCAEAITLVNFSAAAGSLKVLHWCKFSRYNPQAKFERPHLNVSEKEAMLKFDGILWHDCHYLPQVHLKVKKSTLCAILLIYATAFSLKYMLKSCAWS